MKSIALPALIVVETTVLGLAAMGVFGFLADFYVRTSDAIAQETAVAAETEMYIAMLTATPPTDTPRATRSPTPSHTPPPTGTPTSASSGRPPPTRSQTVSAVPATLGTPPAGSTSIRVPPIAPPAATRMSGSWQTVNRCQPIIAPGNYRLGTDLSANGDCINIQTSYAILDCGRHSIRGTNFAGTGIALRKFGANNQSAAYVEVRNCRVSNFRYGIFVESGHHLAIHDNDSSNNYDDVDPHNRYGIFLGNVDGGGIRVNDASDSHIYSNVTLRQAIGIDVRYSNAITVKGNTSSDNSAWGINFYGVNNSEISSNATADNVRRCTWGAGEVGLGCDAGGIALQGGANNNLVTNNRVTGQNGNGIFIKAHNMPCGNNNSIISNTITSVLYNAVELGFCSGNKVNNNAIRDGLDGIWLGFANNTEIRNNNISNMQNHGIISSNSRHNVVKGNVIVNSNEGLFFYSEKIEQSWLSWLPPGDYRSHDNCLCGNIFLDNRTTAIRLRESTGNQLTDNIYERNGRTVISLGSGGNGPLQVYKSWWLPLSRVAVRH